MLSPTFSNADVKPQKPSFIASQTHFVPVIPEDSEQLKLHKPKSGIFINQDATSSSESENIDEKSLKKANIKKMTDKSKPKCIYNAVITS